MATESDTSETDTPVEPAAETATQIPVEVAYAEPDAQVIIPLMVEQGTTIEQAIQQSGVLEMFPAIDLTVNKVGIFSKLSKLDTILREKDRVEI